MEDPVITISLAIAIINVVALACGYYFDKFKITAIILGIFDLLSIITMSSLIK